MQADSVNQVIGTAQGHRAIMFVFQTTAGQCRVTLDFYGNGAQFNGKEYKYAEAAAVQAVVAAGREVLSYSHMLIA